MDQVSVTWTDKRWSEYVYSVSTYLVSHMMQWFCPQNTHGVKPHASPSERGNVFQLATKENGFIIVIEMFICDKTKLYSLYNPAVFT
jgi:hypothetical protein